MITKRIKNNWRGSWDNLSTYKPGDVVSTSSSTWTCRQENSGVTPSEGTFWSAGGYMSLQDGTIFRGWGFNAPKKVSIDSTQSELDTAFQNLKNRKVNLIRMFLEADSSSMSFTGGNAITNNDYKRTLPVGFAGVNLDRIWHLFDVWEARGDSGFANTQLDALFSQVSEAGIEKIRFPLYWFKVAPTKTGSTINYDWTKLDKIVSGAANYGISLMPTIMVAPSWARDNTVYFASIGQPTGDDSTNLAKWNDYLAKKQCSSTTPIPKAGTNNAYTDLVDFAYTLDNRYGLAAPSTTSGFNWASKNKYVVVSSVTGSTNQLQIDDSSDTTFFKVGYSISGVNGIPFGSKIDRIIDNKLSYKVSSVNVDAWSAQTYAPGSMVSYTISNVARTFTTATGATQSDTPSLSSSVWTVSTQLEIADNGSTTGLQVGHLVTGSGIPVGSKISKVIDESNFLITTSLPASINESEVIVSPPKIISITTSMTSSITSSQVTLSPPRITEWQLSNEPDHMIDASLTIPKEVTGKASDTTISFKISDNWPNYPSTVIQLDSNWSTKKVSNPLTVKNNKNDWADSLVAATKAVKNVFSSGSKVIFASLASSRAWPELNLIYKAGGNDLKSIGKNLYVDPEEYASYFEGSAIYSGGSNSYTNIQNDISATDNTISLTQTGLTKFSPGDFAMIIAPENQNNGIGEVVKINSVGNSSVNVQRGLPFGDPATPAKTGWDLRQYDPGLVPYLKYRWGSNFPKIELTEWGYSSKTSSSDQSDKVSSAYTFLYENREAWNLNSVCVFSLISKDPPVASPSPLIEMDVVSASTRSLPGTYKNTYTGASSIPNYVTSLYLTSDPSLAGVKPGMNVSGPGIPVGTKVNSASISVLGGGEIYNLVYLDRLIAQSQPSQTPIGSKIVFSSVDNSDTYDFYGLLKMSGSVVNGVWIANGEAIKKSALKAYQDAIFDSNSTYYSPTNSPDKWLTGVEIKSDFLDKLVNLLDTAAKYDVYVVICGLGIQKRFKSCEPSMNWYNLVHHNFRWAAQSKYWSSIADRVKGHVAVAYLNLMNEPVVDKTNFHTFTTSNTIFLGDVPLPPYDIFMYADKSTPLSYPDGTRVIMYDDANNFDYCILGYNASITNQIQSNGAYFVQLNAQTNNSDWAQSSAQKMYVNFITLGNDDTAVWSKASAYNAGSLVKLNNRYFLAKTQVSANSTSAGNPTPENQLSKWQEINVVGYENGGWNYAWWAQKPTITPTPNQSIEEIKKSWFEVLKNAISRVAPSLPITTGGFETTKYDVDSKPNILHDYLTASTFNDYVTKVNNLSYKGPTVVEEYASEDWGSKADGRMYETKYLGKNSGAYQDLNIFRSTTDATAFITQSVEELNDFTNDSDDVWVRILNDFTSMSPFMNSSIASTRMILPSSQNASYASDYRAWKVWREPFTGGANNSSEPFARNSCVSVFAANAPRYFNSSGAKQDLDTSLYDSIVLSGTAFTKFPFNSDFNFLQPKFKFDSDCLQFTSSWNQSSIKNAYVEDWINQPLGSAVNGNEYKIDNGSISSSGNVILTYKKPIKNGFSMSVGYTYKQGQSQSGLILGFVDKNNYYKINIVDSSTSTSITLSRVSSGTEAVLATKSVGGRISNNFSTDTTLTCDFKNGVLNVSLNFNFFGRVVPTNLDPYPISSLDGYVGVHLAANASPLSNFNLKTGPRLHFYADIPQDIINLAPITPSNLLPTVSGSSTVSSPNDPKSIRYRVKDSNGSLITAFSASDVNPPASTSSTGTKYILYARKPSISAISGATGYTDSLYTVSRGIYNVVSARNNYEAIVGTTLNTLRGGSEGASSTSENSSTASSLAGCYPFGSWSGVIERDPRDYVYVRNTGHSTLTGTSTFTTTGSSQSSGQDQTSFTLVSVSGVSVNQTVTGNGIKPFTTVKSIDATGKTIVISQPTTSAWSNGGSLSFSGNSVELEFDLSSKEQYFGPNNVSSVSVWALVSLPRWDSAINNSIKFGLVAGANHELPESSAVKTIAPTAKFKTIETVSTSTKRLVLKVDSTMAGASSFNPYQGMFDFTNGGTWTSNTSFAARSIVKYTDGKYYISNAAASGSSQAPGSSKWDLIPDIKAFFYAAARSVLPPSGELRIDGSAMSPQTVIEAVSYSNFEIQMPSSSKDNLLPSTWFDISNYSFNLFLAQRGIMATTPTQHASNTPVSICKQWIKHDWTPSSPYSRASIEPVSVWFSSPVTQDRGGLLSGSGYSGDVSSSSTWTNSLKIFRVGGDYTMSSSGSLYPNLFKQLSVKAEIPASFVSSSTTFASKDFSNLKGWTYLDIDPYDRTVNIIDNRLIIEATIRQNVQSKLNAMNIVCTSDSRPGNVKIAGMFMEYMPSPDPTYRSGKILSF